MKSKNTVLYEDFGAVGDGTTDDIKAICAAHNHANSHRLPVKSRPDAEYYIGGGACTAIIETDTDWSTSRFIIDDRDVENNKQPCFCVRSGMKPFEVKIEKLNRDQKNLQLNLDQQCYIRVSNSNVKKFIRFGLNQDKGSDQTDCFIVDKDGSIGSPIDWNYDKVTEATAWPIDGEVLEIKGGTFTTIANHAQSVYDYYNRGIEIIRSNTIIDGVTHFVIGEEEHGSPYRGFLSALRCANVTIQNCFFSGHKIYKTIGSANLPVMMGSYDLNAGSVVNFTLKNCKMNHITDKSRWGVIGSNFCKNILVEDCILSRLDAHMGVSGNYTIRNSHMGWQGINAIGRGKLTLDHVTSYGDNLLTFRDDYGSTWEGSVQITDCKWVISNNGQKSSEIFRLYNNGMHDFGYTCYMPETIEINNLYIDDTALSGIDHELYLFADPCSGENRTDLPLFGQRPYNYVLSKKVVCKGLQAASEKPVYISKNELVFHNVYVELQH